MKHPNNLMHILGRLDKSQAWLGRQVGATATKISMYVCGKQLPTLWRAYDIADALGVAVTDIWPKPKRPKKV